MDTIHEIDKKPWICQKKVQLKELLVGRQQLLNEHGLTLDGSDCNAAGPGEANFKYLQDKLNSFISQDEQLVRPYFLFNSTDERVLIQDPKCQLKMYQKQLEHAKRMISDRVYKVNYLSQLTTTRRETLMRHSVLVNRQDVSVERTEEHDKCDEEDGAKRSSSVAAILVVQMWPQPKKNEKLKLESEILFRSDQSLTELRDQFKCQRDYANPMDLSEDPEQQASDRVFRCELFKSGFLLVEDTFYNDLRDANNTDLSAPIIEWASAGVTVLDADNRNTRVSRGLGPFKRSKMEESKFEDLTLRLGHPYLYLHQGNCEHLFVFSEIRYVSSCDGTFRRAKFPIVTVPKCGRASEKLKCYMCRNGPPHWYTRNNSRLPVDPYFFCDNCFKSFNYDEDKRKIGSFQAYAWNWPVCDSGLG